VRFSEHYGITVDDEVDDWFDPLLFTDTRLFVDPFRVWADKDERWAGAHDHLLKFFAMVLAYVKEAKGNEKSPAWTKAQFLLLFPEPWEFCLGMAAGSPRGSGSGRGLQKDMLHGARTAVGLGITEVEHMELLVLFQEGIGVDRISDITCNVIKDYFIRYTQEVCRHHGVPMARFRVRHSHWDEEFGRWADGEHELPANPYLTGPPGPVLLVPARFLRKIPTVDPGEFWDYAWANLNEQLRGDFNYDLGKRVPAHLKARLARQHPDTAMAYLRTLETDPKPPYDLAADPDLRNRWYEGGRDLAATSPLSFVPSAPADFPVFVEAMIGSFSHGLEESDAWRLLWVDDKPRGEREVQALFRSAVIHYCRAHGIVHSGESNAGRGPVDFKFAANWHAQALVEIKLTSNSRFWHGLRQQTVQYLRSEEVQLGYFVAVGFYDKDFEQKQLDRIEAVARQVSKETGKDVRFALVDARPKESASKLKADEPNDQTEPDDPDLDNPAGGS
jgi:hypothetical protein